MCRKNAGTRWYKVVQDGTREARELVRNTAVLQVYRVAWREDEVEILQRLPEPKALLSKESIAELDMASHV